MISVHQLKKAYGDKVVLHIPALTIKSGESFGLVGNNGAGKTTLFSLVLDLIRPSAGKVLSQDKTVAASEAWKKNTGSYLDEGFLIPYLTPEEYFNFVGGLHQMSPVEVRQFLEPYEAFFNGEILGQKKYIRSLSKGNQKKVGIVAALIGDPDIIVLDEPFANLDPTTQIRLKNLLNELANEKTILISSHDLNHVTDVCNRIVVLEKGEIVKDIETNADTLQELEDFFRGLMV